jgi:hypothetical protein
MYQSVIVAVSLMIGMALTGCSKKQAPAADTESPAEFVIGGIKESVSNLGK